VGKRDKDGEDATSDKDLQGSIQMKTLGKGPKSIWAEQKKREKKYGGGTKKKSHGRGEKGSIMGWNRKEGSVVTGNYHQGEREKSGLGGGGEKGVSKEREGGDRPRGEKAFTTARTEEKTSGALAL